MKVQKLYWFTIAIFIYAILITLALISTRSKILDVSGRPENLSVDKIAQQFIELVNTIALEKIELLFDQNFQKAMPLERLNSIVGRVLLRKGKLLRIESSRIEGTKGNFQLKAERGEWDLDIACSSEAKITAFYFRDPLTVKEVPPRNLVPMSLPFAETWTILSGGDNATENHHILEGSRNACRAFDATVTDGNGKACQSDGIKNEDYYVYGREILASAEGRVVASVDGFLDNLPGSLNPFSSSGNFVIVRHAELEYSAYLHLQQGSIKVRVGENVNAGQILGRCGNSGNSSTPHLHFQLMNAPVPQNACGFPAVFNNVRLKRDGTTSLESTYSPRRGDLIEQAK
jgi:hypothetical protein